jgi:hypothetical protein
MTERMEFDLPERKFLSGGGKLLVTSEHAERAHWSASVVSGWDAGNEFAIIGHTDGSLLISVTEEQAVDSYNRTFTCALLLPPAAAKHLREWMITAAIGEPR